MEYPHKTLLLNGRRVSVQKIIDGAIQGDTPFEFSTLSFIKNWLNGQEKFQLKTSGSTGVPKKITATRNQLVNSAKLTIEALSLQKGGKIFLCIDTQYIGGTMMLVRAFINAMKIEATDPTSIKNFSKFPSCNLAAFVPLQLQQFRETKKGRENLKNIRNIIIGGAPLSETISKILSKSKTNIYATYGMTETFSHIALKRISPNQETVFRVLPTIKINTDERDCLVIKAPFLKKKIITNDIVEIKDGNSFQWLGRFDHVINSGGVKVIPEQVEIEIQKITSKLKIPYRFYVSGEADKRLGKKVVLVFEGRKLTPATEKLLAETMKEQLPRYHAPKKIRYVQQFNLVNNKIKRK